MTRMSVEYDVLDEVDAKASASIFIHNNQELLRIYTEDDAEFLSLILGSRSEFGYVAPLLNIYEAKILLRKFDWSSLPKEIPNHLAFYLFKILRLRCRKYRRIKFRALYKELKDVLDVQPGGSK